MKVHLRLQVSEIYYHEYAKLQIGGCQQRWRFLASAICDCEPVSVSTVLRHWCLVKTWPGSRHPPVSRNSVLGRLQFVHAAWCSQYYQHFYGYQHFFTEQNSIFWCSWSLRHSCRLSSLLLLSSSQPVLCVYLSTWSIYLKDLTTTSSECGNPSPFLVWCSTELVAQTVNKQPDGLQEMLSMLFNPLNSFIQCVMLCCYHSGLGRDKWSHLHCRSRIFPTASIRCWPEQAVLQRCDYTC